MPRNQLRHEVSPNGFSFSLERARSRFIGGPLQVPPDAWQDDIHPGIPLLRLLLEKRSALSDSGKVAVPHQIVSSLVPAETQALELPEACPYSLRLEAIGAFSDESFSIRMTWLNLAGVEMVGLERIGASISSVVERFIIREPLFSLLEEVDRLNGLDKGEEREILDSRMVQIARVKRALEATTGDAAADRYLARITISHGTGIAVETVGSAGDPPFSPVLYRDIPRTPGAFDNEDADVERQPLLPSDQAQLLAQNIFPSQGAWSHYRVGEGAYVVLDAPVVAPLRVLQRVNGSDAETRASLPTRPKLISGARN
jgi:hypothetical protein